MNTKKKNDAEILDSIESFDLDDFKDGAEMVEALFDRKEQIRSLVVDPDLSNNPTDVSDAGERKNDK